MEKNQRLNIFKPSRHHPKDASLETLNFWRLYKLDLWTEKATTHRTMKYYVVLFLLASEWGLGWGWYDSFDFFLIIIFIIFIVDTFSA
jgi:hypothetical protein